MSENARGDPTLEQCSILLAMRNDISKNVVHRCHIHNVGAQRAVYRARGCVHSYKVKHYIHDQAACQRPQTTDQSCGLCHSDDCGLQSSLRFASSQCIRNVGRQTADRVTLSNYCMLAEISVRLMLDQPQACRFRFTLRLFARGLDDWMDLFALHETTVLYFSRTDLSWKASTTWTQCPASSSILILERSYREGAKDRHREVSRPRVVDSESKRPC